MKTCKIDGGVPRWRVGLMVGTVIGVALLNIGAVVWLFATTPVASVRVYHRIAIMTFEWNCLECGAINTITEKI